MSHQLPEHRQITYALSIALVCYSTLLKRLGVRKVHLYPVKVDEL